jgi:hypothetical protein
VVDVTTVRFLRRGFALVAALDCAALMSLPAPAGWTVTLARDTRVLVIEEDGVPLHRGEIHLDIPPAWYQALFTRGQLALLVTSTIHDPDAFVDSLNDARLAGNLVGATIPLTH